MQNKKSKFPELLLLLLLSAAFLFLIHTRFTSDAVTAAAPSPAASSTAAAPAASPTPSGDTALDALQEDLQRGISVLNGSWSVCLVKPSTGESVSCVHGTTADAAMVSGNLIRLWIMGTVYQQVADGTLREADISDDLAKMVVLNDSSAATALVKKLGKGSLAKGMTAVNTFAANCGCKSTKLSAAAASTGGKQNYTSAKDCAAFLSLIYSGKCVSAGASSRMLALLQAQTRRSMIPAGLPDTVNCADLTGDLKGLCVGDAAIVYAPSGNYILCILAKPADNAAAAAQIKAFSQAVYAAMNGAD